MNVLLAKKFIREKIISIDTQSLCQILMKNKKERELENQEREDTPNIRDLYLLVQDLCLKYDKLQTDYNASSKMDCSKETKN